MVGPPKTTSATLRVHFDIDGLYFAEALRHAETISALEQAYTAKRDETAKLNRLIAEAEERNGGDTAAAYDETERHIISLVDSVFGELEQTAGSLGGASATVQILSAACLEAHINARAANMLAGALYKEFERSALGAKWLLYPALMRLTGLDPGNAVLRDVQKLAKRRNALAHPKQHVTEQDKGFKTPEFLENLYLTRNAAGEAIAWTRNAITALAKAESRPVPDWLGIRRWALFRHEWDRA